MTFLTSGRTCSSRATPRSIVAERSASMFSLARTSRTRSAMAVSFGEYGAPSASEIFTSAPSIITSLTRFSETMSSPKSGSSTAASIS
jgi:hypothetical protein